MDRTELSEKDLQIGVWTYGELNAENNVPWRPYNSVPENVYEIDRLTIHLGAWTGLSEKEFRKLRKEWLFYLPLLKNVRFLWIKGSINQELFDAICQMKWLEVLNIRGLISIKDFDSLSNLQNLIHLFVDSCSRVSDIEGLASLKNLITLQVEGFKLIKDISPITKITTLKGLHFEGDMWKKQYLNSLEGIDQLQNLEYLSLSGTEIIEKDILPVTKLKNLKYLEVGYWWTKEDLLLLYGSLKNLKFGGVKDAVESGEYEKYLQPIKL